MEKIRPMLFTTLKKYSGAQLMSDVVAGIIVAIIALPLSIALALASGVGPEQGIYTAIAAGFVISFLGGSQVQIAGPTAAFATIVAGIVAKSGVEGLAVATIMAGIILVIMGFCHFGSLIKFIPFTITTGFTSGIAVTIVIGQLKDFFGVTYPAGMETIETMQKLKAFAAGFGSVNLHAIIVGVVCLAILIVMPMITEKIPGSLVAVIAGILMVKFLPLHVNTIGDLYTVSNKLPAFRLPVFSYDVIQGSLSDAFTIAVLAAIESLLSCVVADGMIGGKHRSGDGRDRAYRSQCQKWRPYPGCRHGSCGCPASDSGSSDAVCKLDPDADHRGNLVYGCLQYVSVENLRPSDQDGSEE